MNTQIKKISIHEFSSYSNVVIQDSCGDEYEMNFSKNVNYEEIKASWNRYNDKTWRII